MADDGRKPQETRIAGGEPEVASQEVCGARSNGVEAPAGGPPWELSCGKAGPQMDEQNGGDEGSVSVPTRSQPSTASLDRFGVPIETALERRERLANRYDYEFGQERVFPELVEALLAEVPQDSKILEVGAATGLLTAPLLERAGHLTALEPSAGMLRRLLAKQVASAPHLSVLQGMAEGLPHDALYEIAVVTFTPRRGVGLLRLLHELARRVTDHVVMLLDEDGSMDWAYLARAASLQGFDVRLHLVSGQPPAEAERHTPHAVVLVADIASWSPTMAGEEIWDVEARVVDVPHPAPRGTATRLVRYFVSTGERALVVRAERGDLERIYGSLRTAVHRLGQGEVTVRRMEDGIQLMRLPKAEE